MPPRSQLDEPGDHRAGRAESAQPHATAVECGEQRLTWRKLDARISTWPAACRASMVRPGRALRRAVAQPPGLLEALFAAR